MRSMHCCTSVSVEVETECLQIGGKFLLFVTGVWEEVSRRGQKKDNTGIVVIITGMIIGNTVPRCTV